MGGSFTPEEFNEVSQKIPTIKDIEIFIETGTHLGDTTIIMSKLFKEVITFEINKIFYEFAKRKLRFLGCSNVICKFGDSVNLLDELLSTEQKPAFFFLDAHHQHITTNLTDVHMDNGSNPLLNELNIINEKYKGPGIICIDDVRLWKNNNSDWQGITNETIISALNKHEISDFFEYNDRFYVIIK